MSDKPPKKQKSLIRKKDPNYVKSGWYYTYKIEQAQKFDSRENAQHFIDNPANGEDARSKSEYIMPAPPYITN
jgi:hypothetical protein